MADRIATQISRRRLISGSVIEVLPQLRFHSDSHMSKHQSQAPDLPIETDDGRRSRERHITLYPLWMIRHSAREPG